MLFNSSAFLAFMIVIFLVYPRLSLRRQNVFLVVAGYVFYGYWDWRFNLLLFISTAVNFWAGLRIHAAGTQEKRKSALFICLFINVGILGFFKYFNFFLDSTATLLETVGFQPHMPVLRIILPIGISFYTFKAMSYTIDVYRRVQEPEKDFIHFALFVSFFPQLVAGPIDRAASLLPQISRARGITRENVRVGVNLVLLGFFKKIAVADTLSQIAESIFLAPGEMSGGQLWTGVYAFTFQIYGDFSGYTDIARGISRILGFETMENFNAPYFSRNISEFWRRWHISLSTWLRDYLYVPLGGNRAGKVRTYVNLILTMLLGGLWHGAAWTFLIWGLLHGVYLAVHRMFLKHGKIEGLRPSGVTRWAADILKILITFHVVAFTWVLFRAPDLPTAWIYFYGLFSRFPEFDLSFPVVFAGMLMIALDIAQMHFKSQTWLTDRSRGRVAFVSFSIAQLMLISIMSATIARVQTMSPFIYFQF